MTARGLDRRAGDWLRKILHGFQNNERRSGYDRRGRVAPAHPMTPYTSMYRTSY